MSDIFNLKEIHEDMDNETLVNNTEVLLIACYKIFITTIDELIAYVPSTEVEVIKPLLTEIRLHRHATSGMLRRYRQVPLDRANTIDFICKHRRKAIELFTSMAEIAFYARISKESIKIIQDKTDELVTVLSNFSI